MPGQPIVLPSTDGPLCFSGVLVAETGAVHQAERNAPLITETVTLHRLDEGGWLLVTTYAFEDLPPHHQEAHGAATPAALRDNLRHPTPAMREALDQVPPG